MSPKPTKKPIVYPHFYNTQDVEKDTGSVYIFGDNLIGKGTAGQATIRNCSNAYGIPTKKYPSMEPGSFFTDEEYNSNVAAIDAAFARIPLDKQWVFPRNGLGTGLAKLQEYAPKTFEYLEKTVGEYLRK